MNLSPAARLHAAPRSIVSANLLSRGVIALGLGTGAVAVGMIGSTDTVGGAADAMIVDEVHEEDGSIAGSISVDDNTVITTAAEGDTDMTKGAVADVAVDTDVVDLPLPDVVAVADGRDGHDRGAGGGGGNDGGRNDGGGR
jgi:hypothetical protein